MKYLGEYNSETADIYKDKLQTEEIFPTAEEVGGYFGASFATMGLLRPKIRLFVEDRDYEKAVALINELERNFEKQVNADSKEVDQAIIKIALGLGLGFLIGAGMYFLNSGGISWWR